ncbi:MAG: hypothetical protein LBH74_08345 [Nitrososphaerota archaeon]|nr:hypothetical protein [Nitrososphaerota archaeon]
MVGKNLGISVYTPHIVFESAVWRFQDKPQATSATLPFDETASNTTTASAHP